MCFTVLLLDIYASFIWSLWSCVKLKLPVADNTSAMQLYFYILFLFSFSVYVVAFIFVIDMESDVSV